MNDAEYVKGNGVKTTVGGLLLLWLALAYILGVNEAFVREPGAPPLPILAGVLTPILVFLVAFWAAGPFRDFVISFDLPLAADIQAWRLGGLGFIALYFYGVLPGLFAWPAGLGDMAIGATAPFVALALRRRPAFATGRLYQVWNLLGMLDLVVAVSLGALSSVLGLGISEAVTTFPMAKMPLVLVPTFFVPLFIILHIVSLIQADRLKEAAKTGACAGPAIRCEPSAVAKRA